MILDSFVVFISFRFALFFYCETGNLEEKKGIRIVRISPILKIRKDQMREILHHTISHHQLKSKLLLLRIAENSLPLDNQKAAASEPPHLAGSMR